MFSTQMSSTEIWHTSSEKDHDEGLQLNSWQGRESCEEDVHDFKGNELPDVTVCLANGVCPQLNIQFSPLE